MRTDFIAKSSLPIKRTEVKLMSNNRYLTYMLEFLISYILAYAIATRIIDIFEVSEWRSQELTVKSLN